MVKTVAIPEEQRVKKAQLEAGGAEVIRQSAQRGGGGGDTENTSKNQGEAACSQPPRCFFNGLNIQIQETEMVG